MAATSLEPDRLQGLRTHLATHPRVTIEVGEQIVSLASRHGLFSARSLDDGTAMMLRELESLPAAARVLDLGCGYGALGISLALRWPDADVMMVDVDLRAVEAARENVDRLGLQHTAVLPSDGVSAVRAQAQFDLVVSNLPAQAGNDALDELLLGGHDVLAADGLLVVVAVNGLRTYLQRRLADIFGKRQTSKVRQGQRHTVLQAVRSAAGTSP